MRYELGPSASSLAALAIGLVVVACDLPPERRLGVPPEVEQARRQAPWLTVDEEALASLAGQPIGLVGFPGSPPKPLEHSAVELSAAAVPPTGSRAPRSLIVNAVISPQGRIAKIQILKGPSDAVTTDAVVRGLRDWRFEPAMLDGVPAAVCMALTVPLVRVEQPRPAA